MLVMLFIIIRWAVIFINSFRYKEYNCQNKDFFTTVIIPVVDEPEEIFCDVVSRIVNQCPDEIIVVINGPENPALMRVCEKIREETKNDSGKTDIKTFYTEVAGKRNAIRIGVENSSPDSDVTVLVDSDTLWNPDTLEKLLMPFSADEKVGGVTTRQKIFKPNRSLSTVFASILEEVRAEGSMKAMSAGGKVGCLPGRTIAFRTSIMRCAMDEFMTEEFLGIHKEVSDDRSLTNIALKNGYKTVLQDSSVVYTDAPVTWKKFFRQQLRWAEGSQYNNLRMTPFMLKKAKLMAFIYWTDMIMPLLLISVYLSNAVIIALRIAGYGAETLPNPFGFIPTVLLIIIGSIFGFGARNIKIMKSIPLHYILFFPVIILILSMIMAPLRVIGLMKCADGISWGTRDLDGNGGGL